LATPTTRASAFTDAGEPPAREREVTGSVLLQEPQPDLGDRRERRNRVPEPVQRHLADQRDGRAVQQVRDLRSHERRADDHPTRRIDDDRGAPGIAVALQRAAGHMGEVVRRHLHVEPTRPCLRLGEPDRAGLRVGEHDLGHGVVIRRRPQCRPVVGLALGAGRDDIPADAALVLAHVRQQRAAVDVADGVQPVEPLDAQRVVDGDVATGFQADGLNAQVVGRRVPTECAQHLVRDDGLAALEGHRHLVTPPDLHDLGAGADDHAGIAQAGGDELACPRFHAAEQPAASLEDRHLLGAQSLRGLRDLAGDDAAAEDREPPRNGVHARRLTRRPRLRLDQARDRRYGG
jgi:hypothetical protein